jgi:hypothetical protein
VHSHLEQTRTKDRLESPLELFVQDIIIPKIGQLSTDDGEGCAIVYTFDEEPPSLVKLKREDWRFRGAAAVRDVTGLSLV